MELKYENEYREFEFKLLTDAISDPMNGPSLKLSNNQNQQALIMSIEPTT